MSLEGSGTSGGASGAIEAGKAYVAIGTDNNPLVAGLAAASQAVSGFTSSIGKAFMDSTSYFRDTFSGLLSSVNGSIERSMSLGSLTDRLGGSVESVSRLSYALSLSGKNLEDVESPLNKIRKSAIEATKDITSEAARMFKFMGIGPKEFLDLNVDERVLKLSEAYNSLGTEIEKAMFAVGLAGKGATGLIEILKIGPDKIRANMAMADQLGKSISGDKVDNAKEAFANLKIMSDAWNSILTGIYSSLVKVIAGSHGFVEIVIYIAKQAKELVNSFTPTVAIIFMAGAAFTAFATVAGLALSLIGVAISAFMGVIGGLITAVTSMFAIVFGLLSSPITLVIAAIAGAIALIILSSQEITDAMVPAIDSIKKAFASLGEGFTAIGETINETFTGIVNAIKNKDFAGATEILVKGSTIAWLQFKDMLYNIFDDVADAWSSMWRKMVVTAMNQLDELQKNTTNATSNILADLTDMFMTFDTNKGHGVTADEARKKIMEQRDHTNRELAIDRLERERAAEDADKEAKTKRDPAAAKARREQLEALKKELSELTQAQNKEFMGPPKPPAEKRTLVDTSGIQQISEAVKGAFQSADFAGSLGFGPASNYAKEQAKIQGNILKEVQAIRNAIKAPEFK